MGSLNTHPHHTVSLIGGWDQQRSEEFRQEQFEGLVPGKIISATRERYELSFDGKSSYGLLVGKLKHLIATGVSESPVVGDWVALRMHGETGMIHHLLTRRNWFSRQGSGSKIDEQIIGANLDYLFITMGLDQDFNLKRLDRYLVMAYHGGVRPVVVLSKADLCPDISLYVARARYERDVDLSVVAVTTKEIHGSDGLGTFLKNGSTILFVGSSGAGKSTLINHIFGCEVAPTGDLSVGNGRGTCTTSMTRGYQIVEGPLLIDASGMREVQLWAEEEDLHSAFDDIAQSATLCKFRDCEHRGEPGCMVRQALLNEQLSHERFLNYMKLKNEIQESRENMLEKKRKRFKAIAIASRKSRRWKYGS